MPKCLSCKKRNGRGRRNCENCGVPKDQDGEKVMREPEGILWCSVCGEEYREGFQSCSDCGAALVDRKPELKNLQPTPGHILLGVTDSVAEAGRILLHLEKANIPAHVDPRGDFGIGQTYAILVPIAYGYHARKQMRTLHETASLEVPAYAHQTSNFVIILKCLWSKLIGRI